MLASTYRDYLVVAAFCVVLCSNFAVASQEALKIGDIILHEKFDAPDGPTSWESSGSGTAKVEGSAEGRSLVIHAPGAEGHTVRYKLDAERYRGTRVTLVARVKAENVAKPPAAWNGVKVMFCTQSPAGPSFTSPQDIYGSFDWKSIEVVAVVPADATSASVVLRIESTSGRIWIDDVKVTLSAVPRKRSSGKLHTIPAATLDQRTEIPRFRGVMYGTGHKPEEVHELATWNANFIRWPLYDWYPGTGKDLRRDMAAYEVWLQEQLAGLDATLPACQQLGIKVLIDLHSPPGSNDAEPWWLFENKEYQDKFREVWHHIVARYKDHPAVWGYDIANEPIEGKVGEGLMDWWALATVTAKRIRALDPHKAIVVAPGPGGGWTNLDVFEPIDVPGVVYSPHFYEPMKMTHQGVIPGMPVGLVYPGKVDGKMWDKQALRQSLEPIRRFQADYNVPILIGEFGVARWAPDGSAERYMRDCIELWEEYQWDWAYHCYRGWHGWSAELSTDMEDMTPAPAPTPRVQLLQKWMSRNQRVVQ